MAYEREAMPESVSVNTNATPVAPATMREERVYSPYKVNPDPKPNIGQGDISKTPASSGTEEGIRLSPGVAALARREQKFRQEREALTKEKATIESEKLELAQLRAMKEKLAAKDYSALDGMVDYNDYSQYSVNKLNGTDPVQEELKKLTGKISEMEKGAEENLTRQFDAAVQERRTATAELISQSPDFPRIKKIGTQAQEAVVQHILDTFEHDKQELSVQQAAKEVEMILLERARQWASLLEDEKKEQLVETPQKRQLQRQLPPMRPALKTLTNQVTASDLTRPKSYQGMSDSDRWAEARRRAEAKLQSQNR